MDLKGLKDLKGTEEYRLVMLQPDPESGERLCVGVLVAGDLLYDESLSRLRCFSTDLKLDLVRFYLSDFRERVARLAGEPMERVAREYAPLIVLSQPRLVVSPVKESTKHMLAARFIGFRVNSAIRGAEGRATVAAVRESFTNRLRHLAGGIVPSADGHLIENARPRDVFGEKRPGVGTVAMAIKRHDKTILMDGVDLNVMRPKEAISATGKVVHTFWQYRLAAARYGDNLQRIAVVFNGVQPREYALRDAHDFAIHQFRQEADDTIEASSQEEVVRLAGLLA